jgi:spore germination protein YaaH
MKKSIVFLFIVLLVILLGGCINKGEDGDKSETRDDDFVNEDTNRIENGNTSEIIVDSEKTRKYSVWFVYWDADHMDELDRIKENVEAISYFAAYFGVDEKPFIPDKTMETFQNVTKVYGNEYKGYLTFVNDLLKVDGKSSLKDTDLLYELLETKDSRGAHIKTILTMVLDNGFDGIEIDYEAIRKDKKLWNYFILFIEELYQSAKSQNILVRVVLEPGIPLEEITLPKGPDYVMMCYNLYGYGTKPGPKANKEFILQMIEKMKAVPGKVCFAIATGGFDFSDNGSVQQVTEEEAIKRLNEYQAISSRHKDSQSLVYTYKDKDGVGHEVWYADHITLDFWFRIIEESGNYGLSLWRIGGNSTLLPIDSIE